MRVDGGEVVEDGDARALAPVRGLEDPRGAAVAAARVVRGGERGALREVVAAGHLRGARVGPRAAPAPARRRAKTKVSGSQAGASPAPPPRRSARASDALRQICAWSR